MLAAIASVSAYALAAYLIVRVVGKAPVRLDARRASGIGTYGYNAPARSIGGTVGGDHLHTALFGRSTGQARDVFWCGVVPQT